MFPAEIDMGEKMKEDTEVQEVEVGGKSDGFARHDEWLAELTEAAQAVADEFYELVDEANERRQGLRLPLNRVTVRVRTRSGSLYIEWQEFFFYRGQNGKWRRGTSGIPKGRGQKYPLKRILKFCNDEEVAEAAAEAEQRFALIREAARAVALARKHEVAAGRAMHEASVALKGDSDLRDAVFVGADDQPTGEGE